MAIIDRKRKLRGRSASCRSLMSVDRDNMLPRMIYGLAWKKVGHHLARSVEADIQKSGADTCSRVYGRAGWL